MTGSLHHALDFVDLVSQHVILYGKHGDLAAFEQHGAKPPGKSGKIEFVSQRPRECGFQTSDVFGCLKLGRSTGRRSGL
ncbi:hypothetical protein GCM10008164_09000 [Achromobacter xylosoxidans]|nr:hypothetical protein GCM10008164_09000 [Achromobacter xylosoxidans]